MPSVDELKAQIKGKECLICRQKPQMAFTKGKDFIRCGCYPDKPPTLVKEQHHMRRRYHLATNAALEKRPEEMPLTIEEVRRFISPLATEVEGHIFLRYCKALGLDPFSNEVYLVKYSERDPAAIVVSVNALLGRAAVHPLYRGYESGIIVKGSDGEVENRVGSFHTADESDQIVGGWCNILKEGFALLRVTVSFHEYVGTKRDGSRTKFWAKMPGTMIEKVAISQALRRGYPKELAPLTADFEQIKVEVGDPEVERKDASKEPRVDRALAEPQKTPRESGDTPSEKGGAPAETDVEGPQFDPSKWKNAGDLMVAVQNRWPGKTTGDVCAALNVAKVSDITDYEAAWAELNKLWD